MAIYTKVDLGQLKELAAQFAIEVESFKAMGFGSANSNYVLTAKDEQKYILSIAEEMPREHVEVTTRVLNWLDDHKFRTARAFKTINGDWSLPFQGKTLTLRSFIHGKVELSLSEGMLGEVGEELATLHRIELPEFLPTQHIYKLAKFTNTIGKGVDPDFERWLEQRLEMLNERIDPKLPKGLIHGDLFADNIIFDERKLEAFIDFEMVCHHYLVYDLGMAVAGLCSRNLELDLEKLTALVQSYMFFRDMDDNEIELLQTFAELAAVHTANWRFWKFNFDSPTPSKKNKHLEMKTLADNIRKIPKEVFLESIFHEG